MAVNVSVLYQAETRLLSGATSMEIWRHPALLDYLDEYLGAFWMQSYPVRCMSCNVCLLYIAYNGYLLCLLTWCISKDGFKSFNDKGALRTMLMYDVLLWITLRLSISQSYEEKKFAKKFFLFFLILIIFFINMLHFNYYLSALIKFNVNIINTMLNKTILKLETW